jgi:hypothetical protein
MSDLGKNLDINPSFGAGKSSGPNPQKKLEINPTPSSSPEINQASIDNKSVYKNPSISQNQLGFEAQERLGAQLPVPTNKKDLNKQEKKIDLPKDYDIKAKNPVLAAQLQNPKSKPQNKQKQKKAPPEPSLQVQYNPRKGIAINPRKVKPSIPGRLQSLVDDTQKPIDKLIRAINEDESYDINLANIYAKKLISEQSEESSESLSELLNIDEDLLEFTKKDLIRQCNEFLSELSQDSPYRSALNNIIQSLQANTEPNLIVHLIQFCLPLPYNFIFSELDDEFFEDEDELKKEFKEKDYEDNDEDENDDEDEEVEHPDCVCSLSLKTVNYNKIHFYIKQNTKTNNIKILIKGDASSSEIIIPIESEIEDMLFDRVNSINYDVSTWKDSILRLTEKRVLKVSSKGNLNPIMLKICNSILKGISNNDINLDSDNPDSNFEIY